MFRYDPAAGKHEQCYSGRPVCSYTIQADGSLLLFMGRSTIAIWRDGALMTVLEDIPDERETRFNDVFADIAGRVFCGTMPTKARNVMRPAACRRPHHPAMLPCRKGFCLVTWR